MLCCHRSQPVWVVDAEKCMNESVYKFCVAPTGGGGKSQLPHSSQALQSWHVLHVWEVKASLDYRGNEQCVSVSNMGLVEGEKGGYSKQHCTKNADAGKKYIIEARNWCSVTKISPNSKKYYIIFCNYSIVNAPVLTWRMSEVKI